jgi:hypothetical protein
LTTPQFFAWGDKAEDRFAALPEETWAEIRHPKHRVIFEGGFHWDYLATESTPCDSARGPCRYVGAATIDLVTMFFAKYLPPELSPNLPDRIPDTLIPPPLDLRQEQEIYGAGHLVGVTLFNRLNVCRMQIDQDLPTDRVVPFVRFMPKQVAARRVRDAGLVPQFSGPTGPGTPWVFTQSPHGGAVASAGSPVSMRLQVGPIP